MTLHSLDHVRAEKYRHHTVRKSAGVEEPSLISFARSLTAYQDAIMKTEISSQLAGFAVAFMMNGLIFAGMNYLFNG